MQNAFAALFGAVLIAAPALAADPKFTKRACPGTWPADKVTGRVPLE